jgi:tol-pal system protein YbgF
MKRLLVLGSALLLGGIVGCVGQDDLQALRADVMALERQRASREKDTEQRVQALSDQLARLEQSQGDVRREMAQAISAAQELRVEIQRLRGEVQETRHRLRREPSPQARDALATKVAELETRLGNLEGGRPPSEIGSPSAPVRPQATAEPPPAAAPAPPPPAAAPTTTRPVTAMRPPPAAGTPPPSTPPASTTAGGDEADRLYKQALQEYQQNNHEVAIVRFKQFLRQYAEAPLAGNAQYWIGESLYAQKQYEAAIVAFDEVIRKYPKDNKVPAALLKQGFAFAELKDVRNARFFLQQVQQKYPNSPEAQQAAEKLKQLQRQG